MKIPKKRQLGMSQIIAEMILNDWRNDILNFGNLRDTFKYKKTELIENCKPEYLEYILELYNSGGERGDKTNLEIIIQTENVWKI